MTIRKRVHITLIVIVMTRTSLLQDCGVFAEEITFKENEQSVNGIAPDSRHLEITVDSGAAESVMPNWYSDYKWSQTHKFGRGYRVANGSRIENSGETQFKMLMPDGGNTSFHFQVVDQCTKPLGSVMRMAPQGNRIVFDDEEGSGRYAEHKKSGKRTWFRKKNGVYVIDAIFKPSGPFPGPV